MNIQQHRKININDDDDEEGELDSSSSDEETTPKDVPAHHQTSQSWTEMLTSRDLSSVMSGAMSKKNSEIIHIDDPIAQQSENPLSYVFPPDIDQEEFFRRKREQDLRSKKSIRKPNRRDVKNLSHILHNEKNEDLLRATLNILGCRRAFELANEVLKIKHDDSILISESGQQRTLGGIYFKMLMNNSTIVTENEREQIKQHNQTIQKDRKKKNRKKKKN